MKLRIIKYLLVAFVLLSADKGLAQLQGIGGHFGAYDFYGPQTGTYFFAGQQKIIFGADNAPNDTTKKNGLLWKPLVRVTYWFQLNRWFDINLGLSLADLQYPASKKDSVYILKALDNYGNNKDQFLGEFDARLNFNILAKDKYIFAPYLFAGALLSYHPIYFGADVPLGIGLNVHLSKTEKIYLNLEAGYEVAITSNDFNHLQYTAGLVYWFKPGYRAPSTATSEAEAPEMPIVIADMDHDGVPDSIDKCPTIPGPAEFDGCPDTDGDGVADNVDECPLVVGLKQFNGCPDTDGDGIPDNKDKCPYVAGLAQYDGCPPPDTDHDGVPDDSDMCPTVPGPASNHGCPLIKKEVIEKVEKAAHSIFFETGKATIKKVSYKSLNAIVKVMKDDPTLYAEIDGYTDNVGKSDVNMKLSQDRSDACRNYLVSQGVSRDRITSNGYGDTKPVASNKTALGRAQNRRTEFKLRNYK